MASNPPKSDSAGDLGRSQRPALRTAIGVAVLAVVIALPLVFTAGFYADDFFLMQREEIGWVSAVTRYLSAPDPDATHYNRPGSEIIQQSLQSVIGTEPVIMHGWNLLLRLCDVYLLFPLARSLTGDRDVAGLAEAIYPVHPTHDESEIWGSSITGLTDTPFNWSQ